MVKFLKEVLHGQRFASLTRGSHPTKTSFMQTQVKQRLSSALEQQGIEFRLATSKDALDMVNFHNSYYGTGRGPEHWLWEYQTYEPEKTVFAFAKDRDKLIATQGVLPICMEVGTECLVSGKAENTLILPPYRGTAIFRSLQEYAFENCTGRGMQFVWGFTGGAVRAFQESGFTCYQDIQVLMRPGNIWVDIVSRLRTYSHGARTPLWRRIGTVGKLILKSFFARNSKTIPQIEKQAGYEIKKGEICDQRRLKELCQRMRSKHKNIVSIKYDQRYLRWRVREHPLLKYDEYQVYQGAKLRAYAFVVLSHGIATISDLLSEDRHATSLLLYTILKDYVKKAGRFQFLGNLKDLLAQDLFDQLRQFGFSVDEKTGKYWIFILRDLSGGKNKQFFDIRNWHVTGLWTEGFLY